MKVAIVGGSPSSEMQAPFDDPEWEIWALGIRLQNYSRVNRVFEIHDKLDPLPDGYGEWLAKQNLPTVVGRNFPVQADHIEVFPFDKAKELFGYNYLTSSGAYMVAYAILHGVTHLSVYGMDMCISGAEYFKQRPCMEAWLGFAKARGIEVTIHDDSPLLKSAYLYGQDSPPDNAPFTADAFKLKADEHQKKMDEHNKQIKVLSELVQTHHGAFQAYNKLWETARAVESGQQIKSLTHAVVTK